MSQGTRGRGVIQSSQVIGALLLVTLLFCLTSAVDGKPGKPKPRPKPPRPVLVLPAR